ncbi:hypothetical protein RRG08_015651, partial [Elysia crispata]
FKGQADTLSAQFKGQADTLSAQFKGQADTLSAQFKGQADTLSAQFKGQADTLSAQFKGQADTLSAQFKGQADTLSAQFKGQADTLSAQFKGQADTLSAQFKGQADTLSAQFKGQADTLSAQFKQLGPEIERLRKTSIPQRDWNWSKVDQIFMVPRRWLEQGRLSKQSISGRCANPSRQVSTQQLKLNARANPTRNVSHRFWIQESCGRDGHLFQLHLIMWEILVLNLRSEPVLFQRVDEDYVPYSVRHQEQIHNMVGMGDIKESCDHIEACIRKEAEPTESSKTGNRLMRPNFVSKLVANPDFTFALRSQWRTVTARRQTRNVSIHMDVLVRYKKTKDILLEGSPGQKNIPLTFENSDDTNLTASSRKAWLNRV